MPIEILDPRAALLVIDLQRGTLGNPTVQPDDLIITRRTWNAFAGTDLDATLSALGVSQVVIVGVATSFGVESTARHAYDHGYNVVLATDAMTDLRAEAHEHSVTRIFPLIGQTGTTAEIVALAAA